MLVLPDFLDFSEPVSRKGTEDPDSGRYAEDRAGDDVSELYDIREYRAGDPVSRIHWKLLGRQEEIYIKEGGFPLEESPLLAADLADYGQNRGLSVRIQREDIFNAMHKI